MSEIIEGFFNLIDVINTAYPIAGPIVFILVLLFDRDRLKVKLDALAKFLAFLVIFGLIKICLWNGNKVGINPHGISMANFMFVFLEDAFFVMIPFYLTKFVVIKRKYLVWIFFSLIFGVAHRYQGIPAIFVTALYPYFISNKFAARTSFGTVMVGHFLWDCFVMVLPKINNLLYLMDRLP